MKTICFIILVLFAHQMLACSCAGNPSVVDSWNSYDQIFIGQVVSIDTANSYNSYGEPLLRYTFVIKESFKGEIYHSRLKRTIYSISFGGSCDSHFELNTDYLIYARDYLNILKSSICSRTEELNRVSSGEIEKLRELHKGYITPKVDLNSMYTPTEKDLELAKKQILDLTKTNKILYGMVSVLGALLVGMVIVYFRTKKYSKHPTNRNHSSNYNNK
jgi:hypothetical protein